MPRADFYRRIFTLPYWGEKIAEAKQALKGREQMGLAEWMGDSARYGVGMVGRMLFGKN
jgi:hypothetical protein